MSDLRHYLVVRDEDQEPNHESPCVWDFGTDEATALLAYETAERHGSECVLLGADSVATLRQTHGNWVTEGARFWPAQRGPAFWKLP